MRMRVGRAPCRAGRAPRRSCGTTSIAGSQPPSRNAGRARRDHWTLGGQGIAAGTRAAAGRQLGEADRRAVRTGGGVNLVSLVRGVVVPVVL